MECISAGYLIVAGVMIWIIGGIVGFAACTLLAVGGRHGN